MRRQGWSAYAKVILWEHSRTDLPTGSVVGKEASAYADSRLNSSTEVNCSEVTLVKVNELSFSRERPEQDVKKISTILEETPPMEKPNEEDDHRLILGEKSDYTPVSFVFSDSDDYFWMSPISHSSTKSNRTL